MAVTATVVNSSGGAGQFPLAYSNLWFVTAAVDPASVATQATGTDTITVPGVVLGDHVLSKGFAVTGSEAAVTVTAYVSAANTVTLLYSNNTAGAVDLATGTFKCIVGRPAF